MAILHGNTGCNMKDAVNRWQYQYSGAYLNTEFGLELACKKFGLTPDQLKEKVGVYVRGKRKGQLKGKLIWAKVTKGGWVKTGRYDFETMTANGFIAKPGTCFAFQIVDSWTQDVILNHDETVMEEMYPNAKESLILSLRRKSNGNEQKTSI